MSIEDKRVLQLWEDKLTRVGKHIELPMPWRDGQPNFPNNYPMALKRLHSLMYRLKREQLYELYADQIQKFIDEGYAEVIPQDEINITDGSVWYLPHHYVRKKDHSLRVVHDCAAEMQGVSLNK